MMEKLKSTKLLKSQKGQSMVEFALIIPIFLLLSLGTIEFGNAFSQIHSINQTTKLIARAASTGETSDNLRLLAENSISSFISGVACGAPADGSSTTTITCSTSSETIKVIFSPQLSAREIGKDIVVEISTDYNHVTDFFTFSLPLKKTNITKVEYVPATP